MLQSEEIDNLITVVAALDRAELVRQFKAYPANFPLDFTPEFLERQPLERLQHLFVALCLQHEKLPALDRSEAA